MLEILVVVDRDLGLSDMNISDYQNKKVNIRYLTHALFLSYTISDLITV